VAFRQAGQSDVGHEGRHHWEGAALKVKVAMIKLYMKVPRLDEVITAACMAKSDESLFELVQYRSIMMRCTTVTI
jgi:hypothetical protein